MCYKVGIFVFAMVYTTQAVRAGELVGEDVLRQFIETQNPHLNLKDQRAITRPTGDFKYKGILNHYLRNEYKVGLESIYSEDELDAVFSSMDHILSSKENRIQLHHLVKNPKAARRNKKLFSKFTKDQDACDSDLQKLALQAFLMREYEEQQMFDSEDPERRHLSMQRFKAELAEARLEELTKESKTDSSSMGSIVEDLKNKSNLYSKVSNNNPDRSSRYFLSQYKAAQNLECSARDEQMIQALFKIIAQVRWTDKNRKEILDEILKQEPLLKINPELFKNFELYSKKSEIKMLHDYKKNNFDFEDSFIDKKTIREIIEKLSSEYPNPKDY